MAQRNHTGEHKVPFWINLVLATFAIVFGVRHLGNTPQGLYLHSYLWVLFAPPVLIVALAYLGFYLGFYLRQRKRDL